MLPRILVIDDIFGREIEGVPHRDRLGLCAKFLLREVSATGSALPSDMTLEISEPIAEAVFCRGQRPARARVGDTVRNDLPGTLDVVRSGWTEALREGELPWAMVLVDLCFYTGEVTEKSNRIAEGVPRGVTSDDKPGSYFGLQVLDAIHRAFPQIPVLILSSKPRESVSLEFSRRGAIGFIERDDPMGTELLQKALWTHGLLSDSSAEIIGNSLPILFALREARRAVVHRQNILIRGERGSGKELMAQYLHRVSAMGERSPFVTINSALLTTSLFTSELFGITSRTATGVDAKMGLIEAAHGGDLFLDEIADMPQEIQAAVLRVLQDREITPVGSRQSKKVDVRFLSATNLQIEEEDHKFRRDLLDRLRVGGTIWMPSLRERVSDIARLAEIFVKQAEREFAISRYRSITPEALDLLNAYPWPGNIRELRSQIFGAVSQNPDVEYLVPNHLRLSQTAVASKPSTVSRANPVPAASSQGRSAGEPVVNRPLEELLETLDTYDFSPESISDWAGQFNRLLASQRHLAARHLEAALKATKRRTVERPNGEILIHPAIKLLTGNPSITASQAADVIKRTLAPLEAELSGTLLAAYEVATRLRRPAGAARATGQSLELSSDRV